MKNIFIVVVLCLISLSTFAAKDLSWFQGSVEEALKEAEKSQKPLFVYWGAVWCPPCNQIKKTIFTKSEFQKEANQFVTVYLDGDLPEAQKWGDYFGTVGYPTMMILNPKGQEIYRMPFGLNAVEYAGLMKSVRSGMSDLKTLLAKKNKTELEWGILARHSWEQEKEIKPDYKALSKDCVGAFCARFSLLALDKELEDEKNLEKTTWQKWIENTLRDSKIVRQNLSFFSFEASSVIKGLYPKESYKKIAELWIESTSKFIDDSTLSLDERLTSIYPRLDLAMLVDEKISPELASEVKRRVDWVDFNAKDLMERQSVMSTAIYFLMEAKLYNDAKKMALNEIKKSKSPYYFMSYLSSIEKELGHEKEALDWSRKAWQSATGSATRFQWATSYLLKAPKSPAFDEKTYQNDLASILDEVLREKDAFQGRNKARFRRLVEGVSKDRPQDLKVIKDKCQRQKAHQKSCQELMVETSKKGAKA